MNILPDHLQVGDILACYGNKPIDKFISLLSFNLLSVKRLKFGPSHIAIIIRSKDKGLLWAESTTNPKYPCVLTNTIKDGVQAHFIDERTSDYADSTIDVYRLTGIDSLEEEEIDRLWNMLQYVINRPYDLPGALMSGTPILKNWFRYGNLDSIFCSEMIAAFLQRLCRLNRSSPTSFTPAKLIRQLVIEGTYLYHGQLRLIQNYQ